MSHRINTLSAICLTLCAPVIVVGEARLFFVPQSGDPVDFPPGPTMVQLNAGDSFVLEIFVDGVAPELLRGVQFVLPFPVEGSAGSVTVDGALSNVLRPDYVLRPSFASCDFNLNYGAAAFACETQTPVLVTEPGYFAELAFEVSADACGSFTFEFASSDTIMLNPDAGLIPFTPNVAIIKVERYGDANYDGGVDMFDIFCVLDGFQGVFNHCPFENLDIAGCTADGRVDLFDIFAVLDAFVGINPCPDWCGTPVKPRLFLVREGDDPAADPLGPGVVEIAPGESITFSIFVENVAPDSLQSGQFGFPGMVTGETGQVVETLGTQFFNLPEPLVFTQPPVSVGFITYEASSDAAGIFPIDFNIDGEGSRNTFLSDERGRSIPFTPDGAVIVVKP